MQTTYRIKAQEISMAFLKSLKTLFAGQEIEIIVRSVSANENTLVSGKNKLLEMIGENRQSAPVISPDVNIRNLIDDSQYPAK